MLVVFVVLLVLTLLFNYVAYRLQLSASWEAVSALLFYAWITSGFLLAVASLQTGIQKKRPGLGVVCMLFTPLGFLIAYFADASDPAIEAEVRRKYEAELAATNDHWKQTEIEDRIKKEIRERIAESRSDEKKG